jgi:hypothetical protein
LSPRNALKKFFLNFAFVLQVRAQRSSLPPQM